MKIQFQKSGKTREWDDRFENILDLAEANGIQLENACRVGVCGTCKVKLLSGEVYMEPEDGLQDEDRNQNRILPVNVKKRLHGFLHFLGLLEFTIR